MEDYVWYFAYGSNILKERFLCYITGDPFKWRGDGKTKSGGCKNKNPPQESREHKINHTLYFAGDASTWNKQGVAFISPKETPGHEILGRVWKITKEQYEQILGQEGSWYSNEIKLGQIDGIPIWTITSFEEEEIKTKPSKKYIKTIMCGLEETYKGKNEGTQSEICNYLSKKEGIKNNYSLEDLKKLFNTNEP